MNKRNAIELGTQQANACIIETVKEARIEACAQRLDNLTSIKDSAMNELDKTESSIQEVIASNRGGKTGVHGFIGERVQVGVSNARDIIDEKAPQYYLIDDNGPVDYMKGDIPIQQKACISDKTLGLKHVAEHSDKYPEFVRDMNGVYQIPKDLYARYKALCDLPAEAAGKLRNDEYRLWQKIQEIKSNNPDVVVEPMAVDYKEIQADTVNDTLTKEKTNIEKKYEEKKDAALKMGKASWSEGIKCTAVSAVIEGTVGAGASIYVHSKAHDGHITDITKAEWKEVGVDSLKSVGKGAVRGASVYVLTNCANMPAHWACATTTAAMSSVRSVYKYAKGDISGVDCVEQIAAGAADAAVCAVFSKIGGKFIPIQHVGNFVGGAVGALLWGATKSGVSYLHKQYVMHTSRAYIV